MGFDFKDIIEISSEGIVIINKNLNIVYLNSKAKDILGLRNKYDISHKKGILEKGDIIIIGDTSFGDDDGGLNSKDLIKLGLNIQINKGDFFLFIGRYGYGGKCNYGRPASAVCRLEDKINNNNFLVEIDYSKKVVNININGINIPYEFIKSVGHMVILDNDLNLKFYQSKGYTIRGESIREILLGKEFMEKSKDEYFEINVLNRKIDEVFKEGNIYNYVNKVITTKEVIKSIYDEINKLPVRCSFYNIDDFVVVKIEDISEIKKLHQERLELLREISKFSIINNNFYFGKTNQMKQIEKYIHQIAKLDGTILLLGESGTGKSSLAKHIHQISGRKGEFVEINCGAIPEALIESELFGYTKGAFTGALSKGKKGLIECADGGTVFLDEIAELPLNLQVKLLDVIQNRRVKPIGSNEYIEVDVRFICATNKEIHERVKQGMFREDLYYRINVFPIKLPALRERKEDLYDLIYFITREICNKYGVPTKKISNAAYYKLYNYDFPGNIRELENILERAINLSITDTIEVDDILLDFTKSVERRKLKDILEETEKSIITEALKRNNGDKKKTMEELGIKKSAFYEKLKKYDIC
ncbi:sigma 54-interacting transcriptional regulator [Thermobrachium celere]|uniref:Sigma-54 factor interaction domain-containing protein n=1 Tax=Thermobrachium celere DSM 8682 TaxID=941824 RepID=R7RUZ1_9CLOT|nr:sigma 54-interacting transcriptional regulator [Thermobrachium celere]CDF59406.1 hypothetical protein TCEL_00872 [Thermobrachium celere DSM 8682]